MRVDRMEFFKNKNQFLLSRRTTFLGLGVLLPLLVFSLLASHIWQQGQGFSWDVPILQWLYTTQHPLLETIARTLTPLGVFWGVFPVLAVLGTGLIYQRKGRSLLYLMMTPLGSALLNYRLKFLFHRERPHLWENLSPDLSYAFPSGHAMSSVSFVMVLIVLTWNTRWRWLAVWAGGGFVGIIGWTRLYLGRHYPSDVLGGWMLALAWSVAVMLLIQPQNVASCESDRLSEPIPPKVERS
ncbi:MAG: phosphatase PAP2 family protein [Scytolyngbya sp. HA4215-MV1]|jgi:undecaprenyl-diphosphatase|nr:phosphatase PAP2 family protein [Scytolyngbya sp. HA4215-MV1]